MTAPLSYWHDSLVPGDDGSPRAPLRGGVDADVAIVGAGFTGLWTAYYLRRADPSLRVVVLERETAGFGASGRNGGWCIGDPSGPAPAVERTRGAGAAEAMARAMHRTVDEVGSVIERERIDCGWAKAGAVIVARNAGQLARLRHRQSLAERYGYGDAWTMLDREQTMRVVQVAGAVGAQTTPHAAALHPARLARGLACAVERHGCGICEQTTVRSIEGCRVRTDHGTVHGEVVVRATEAYSVSIRGHERTILPLGNYVVATEPIAAGTPGVGSTHCATSASHTTGVACSACHATCFPASATTPRPVRRGPVATSAKASLPPTPRAARSPTSSAGSTAT
ncbi:MAG: NAD(P)/FAD-dependent oxidoreductase [Acidimicrobiales bacterium]